MLVSDAGSLARPGSSRHRPRPTATPRRCADVQAAAGDRFIDRAADDRRGAGHPGRRSFTAYSLYQANFSLETTCQSLRAGIIAMLDKTSTPPPGACWCAATCRPSSRPAPDRSRRQGGLQVAAGVDKAVTARRAAPSRGRMPKAEAEASQGEARRLKRKAEAKPEPKVEAKPEAKPEPKVDTAAKPSRGRACRRRCAVTAPAPARADSDANWLAAVRGALVTASGATGGYRCSGAATRCGAPPANLLCRPPRGPPRRRRSAHPPATPVAAPAWPPWRRLCRRPRTCPERLAAAPAVAEARPPVPPGTIPTCRRAGRSRGRGRQPVASGSVDRGNSAARAGASRRRATRPRPAFPGCQSATVARSASVCQRPTRAGLPPPRRAARRKSLRGISRKPMSRSVGVSILPSLKAKPHFARCQFSTVKPIFEVFGSRENCDSVTKALPIATP